MRSGRAAIGAGLRRRHRWFRGRLRFRLERARPARLALRKALDAARRISSARRRLQQLDTTDKTTIDLRYFGPILGISYRFGPGLPELP
jgi:hypothetical protein